MSFKCGNCHERHDSVSEARACYGAKPEEPKYITEKQAKFLNHLREERGLPVMVVVQDIQGNITSIAIDPDTGKTMLRSKASSEIDRLIHKVAKLEPDPKNPQLAALFRSPEYGTYPEDGSGDAARMSAPKPLKPAQDPGEWTRLNRPNVYDWGVPTGRYAIQSLTGNNDLDFFYIKRPGIGRWAGYTFVRRVIGGHPDMPVRGKIIADIMQAILDAGIEESGILFGRTLKTCRHCGRHLTDEVSRAMGAGPECRSKRSAA